MKILQQAIKEIINLKYLKEFFEPIIILTFLIAPFIISLLVGFAGHYIIASILFILSMININITIDIVNKYQEIKANLEKEEENANI